MSIHEKESTPHHLKLVSGSIKRETPLDCTKECFPVAVRDLHQKHEATSEHFLAVHREVARLAEEMNCQLSPLMERLAKLESRGARICNDVC